MPYTSVRDGGPALKGPWDFKDSPLSRAGRQPLLLGLFLTLQDLHISTYPTSNSWAFDYNLDIVKKGEELGFDLAFSRTQWLPKGGYDGESSLDAFIGLGAMAAATKNILLISTIHVLYGPLHPLHIAKYGATLDHISKGRWGINIVTGHRAVEHEMFGWQRIEHDKRYRMAGELFDVVDSLWQETENLTYDGQVSPWKLSNAWITPKPEYGRPVLVNATGSPAGIEFAARYSDLIFITSPGGSHIESALETLPDHIKAIKDAAKKAGRPEVRTLINPIIVSRDTPEEAEAYANAIVEGLGKDDSNFAKFGNSHRQPGEGDEKGGKTTDEAASKTESNGDEKTASHGWRRGLGYDSDAHAWRGRRDPRHKQGLNIGGNIEIIGSPQQVVDQLKALHETGIDGVVLNFYDFKKDLDYFGKKILPLVKEAGLRI